MPRQDAHERIEKLEAALLTVRANLKGGDDGEEFDPFDVIERSLEVIERALKEKVAA
ncbi:hypothetical protein [Bradyrhizobium sp. Tv2a-2]|uniref:hypothetical protein n=1 Tax=Bradyrhizobium sp. Tv2a-2 TaxID=113395 RepID=UPI0004275A35|nr:hypothetical protein [Bradyrhizobium sp. Tv2a-2]